jgi:2'-5' RNA ligase
VKTATPVLTGLGFEAESRPYEPHITLARSQAPAGGAALRRLLEAGCAVPRLTSRVGEIVLFESRLNQKGARYVPVHKTPFSSC